MKKIIYSTLALGLFFTAKAQQPIVLSNGDNTLKIGATVSLYYNYRQYSNEADRKPERNTFRPKDARLDLEGNIGKDYEYHLQFDFAQMGSGVIDPANPPVYDANFTYKGFKKFANITIGYDKVPYSYSSLVEHEWSPFWDRALIVKGDVFSRRDLGIRLDRTFLNKRLKAYAGVYTGVGELALQGINDPSGNPEFIARLEYAYPQVKKKELVDLTHSSIPFVAVGVNARYANKALPAGGQFLAGETGALFNDSALNYKVINGEKWVYGADVNLMYKGFGLLAEAHIIKGTPQLSNDPLLMGLPSKVTNGYFRAGGWFMQGSYHIKKANTVLCVRYDEFKANDLITGRSKYLTASVVYQFNGFHSMVRFQFFRNLEQTESININKWENQFRVGWQFMIQ